MTGTGSHMFLGWETADQVEKGIAGSYSRKSRVLEWETAERYGKKDRRLIVNRKPRVLEWETADQWEKRDGGLIQPEVTCFRMGNR